MGEKPSSIIINDKEGLQPGKMINKKHNLGKLCSYFNSFYIEGCNK